MATTVTYKGNTLTTVNNQTKVLNTSGTYLEDNITLVDVSSGGGGIYQDQNGYLVLSDEGGGGGGGVLNVTLTQTNGDWFPDKTFSEITSAHNAGDTIVVSAWHDYDQFQTSCSYDDEYDEFYYAILWVDFTQDKTYKDEYLMSAEETIRVARMQLEFPKTLGTKTITVNGTYNAYSDLVDGYSSVTVNVPGGPSNFTLLGTLAVGAISTTSTTATDTGKSITVKGIYDYDLLVCECSVDTKTNGRHIGTTRLIWLTASNDIGTKNGAAFATATWNAKLSSSGVVTSRSNTTQYGIYAQACTVSAGSTGDNGQAVITIYQRYNNTQTGTINGSYTMRIYGVKIYDLIGG